MKPEEIAAARAEHEMYGSEFQTPAWDDLGATEREDFRRHAMHIITRYLAALGEDAVDDMAREAFRQTQSGVAWANAHGARENFRRYMQIGVQALLSRALQPKPDERNDG